MDRSKSVDEALGILRGAIISCLAFYLIFTIAFPKLREVSEEERIVPDVLSWSTLRRMTSDVVFRSRSDLSPTDLRSLRHLLPGNSNISFEEIDGIVCFKPWIRTSSGNGAPYSHKNRCPSVRLGLNAPGYPGSVLLLYEGRPPEDSIIESILFPYLSAFDEPTAASVGQLPIEKYVIVKMRALTGTSISWLVIPRADLATFFQTKRGSLPSVLPLPGPSDGALLYKVLKRAGRSELFGKILEGQLDEFNLWLSERVRNPPKTAVFGVSMDLGLISSLFGIFMALFGFTMIGPCRLLSQSRDQPHTLSWTMTTSTIAGTPSARALEVAACLFSIVFSLAPVAFVITQMWLGIPRPLDTTTDAAIAIANLAAAIGATAVFFAVSWELRLRRQLPSNIDDDDPASLRDDSQLGRLGDG